MHRDGGAARRLSQRSGVVTSGHHRRTETRSTVHQRSWTSRRWAIRSTRTMRRSSSIVYTTLWPLTRTRQRPRSPPRSIVAPGVRGSPLRSSMAPAMRSRSGASSFLSDFAAAEDSSTVYVIRCRGPPCRTYRSASRSVARLARLHPYSVRQASSPVFTGGRCASRGGVGCAVRDVSANPRSWFS